MWTYELQSAFRGLSQRYVTSMFLLIIIRVLASACCWGGKHLPKSISIHVAPLK